LEFLTPIGQGYAYAAAHFPYPSPTYSRFSKRELPNPTLVVISVRWVLEIASNPPPGIKFDIMVIKKLNTHFYI
jgi:hypothetical protein